ncbi:MAG: hypothetical protein LJE90_15155 [Betaproteobacteria bacterium]|jgi:hypothetical protein|nr:hypothetical protein [Betaproteobacteria bacterium]
MDRPNWKFLLPSAAVGGFVLVGFWGLLVGPLGTAWYVSWRRKRDGSETAEDEDARLAVFMAEAARDQMAASGRKAASAAASPGTAAATRAAAPRPVTPASAPRAPSSGAKPSFAALRQRVLQLEGKALIDAFARARLAEIENGRDAHASVEVALIARRAATQPLHAAVRLRAASRAIAACLESGQSALAAAVFGEYVAERTALRLAREHWEPLGRALLDEGAMMEAAWTLHAGAVHGNDLLSAQKRLIEVAGKAAQAGQPKIALKLYETVLAKYPDTQYADFVRSNMRIEEKKLAKSTAPA